MKKLSLVLLATGCIHYSADTGYEFKATPEAGGTRVTVPARGVSLVFPTDGNSRGAQTYGDIIRFGVEKNGYVANPEVEVNLAPDATTLAEMETTLRMWCLKLEFMSKQATPDGFAMMYACTNKDTYESFFKYYQVSEVDHRKIACSAGGGLPAAKFGQQVCPTLAPATTTDPKISRAQ